MSRKEPKKWQIEVRPIVTYDDGTRFDIPMDELKLLMVDVKQSTTFSDIIEQLKKMSHSHEARKKHGKSLYPFWLLNQLAKANDVEVIAAYNGHKVLEKRLDDFDFDNFENFSLFIKGPGVDSSLKYEAYKEEIQRTTRWRIRRALVVGREYRRITNDYKDLLNGSTANRTRP